MIQAQGIAHLVQQARHGVGGNTDAEALKFVGDAAGRAPGPAQACHRIAGGVVFQQVGGEVAELLEFAEYGEIGGGAQHAFELRQISDLVTAQVLTQQSRVEGGGAHNVRVPT